jgi:hypothetical protein
MFPFVHNGPSAFAGYERAAPLSREGRERDGHMIEPIVDFVINR